MAATLGTSDLTYSVADAWIRTGDIEVLERALKWPDIPGALIQHIGELTLTEYANDGKDQIRLITLIAKAAERQEINAIRLGHTLDQLTARLEELSNEDDYTQYGLAAAAEALQKAYTASRAPSPDSPLMSTEPPTPVRDRPVGFIR